MLELFRKNLFVYNLFLLLYCIILNISWFFVDTPVMNLAPGILSDYLYETIGIDSILTKVLNILLLSFQAIQINRLVSIHRLTPQNTLFPGVFYILLCSICNFFIPLLPQLIANTFIIMALMDIFYQTRNTDIALKMFNVGLWIGVAGLFYFPYVLFLIPGLLGVLYLRTFKYIDIFRALTGAVIPFFLLGTVYFVADELPVFLEHFQGVFRILNIVGEFDWKSYVVIAIFALLSLIAIMNSNTFAHRQNIHIRRKIMALFFFLVAGIVLIVLVAGSNITSLLFASIPLAFMTGAMILRMEKQFAEVVHFGMFAIALLFQYVI